MMNLLARALDEPLGRRLLARSLRGRLVFLRRGLVLRVLAHGEGDLAGVSHRLDGLGRVVGGGRTAMYEFSLGESTAINRGLPLLGWRPVLSVGEVDCRTVARSKYAACKNGFQSAHANVKVCIQPQSHCSGHFKKLEVQLSMTYRFLLKEPEAGDIFMGIGLSI